MYGDRSQPRVFALPVCISALAHGLCDSDARGVSLLCPSSGSVGAVIANRGRFLHSKGTWRISAESQSGADESLNDSRSFCMHVIHISCTFWHRLGRIRSKNMHIDTQGGLGNGSNSERLRLNLGPHRPRSKCGYKCTVGGSLQGDAFRGCR